MALIHASRHVIAGMCRALFPALACLALLCGGPIQAATAQDCESEAKTCAASCTKLYKKSNPKFWKTCTRDCKRDRKICLRAVADPANAPTTSPQAERKECERDYKACLKSCKTKVCQKNCKQGRAQCLRDNYSRPLNPEEIAPVVPRNAIKEAPRVAPRPVVGPGLLEGPGGGFSRQAPAPTGTPVTPLPPPSGGIR